MALELVSIRHSYGAVTALDGVSVTGRIDLVRRIDTDETTIVDLKSSDRAQPEDVTETQLHVYALGYEELTGRRADFGAADLFLADSRLLLIVVNELRHRLRTLIDENLPDDYVGPFHNDEAVETTRRFVKLLAERHLLTVGWPEEWGGTAASVWE